MGWFGRQRNNRSTRTARTGVASDLSDFLVLATEGRALRQAIDARMLVGREAESDPDGQRGTDGIVSDQRAMTVTLFPAASVRVPRRAEMR